MSKNLYILLIGFLAIATAGGIWNFIIAFEIGPQIYTLDASIPWLLVVNITGWAGLALLLKYYYDQSYRVAFFTGGIAAITSVCYTAVFFIILITGEHKSYYSAALLFGLCTTAIYHACLIFSNTQKKYWLKLGGICGVVVCLAFLSSFMAVIYPKNIQLNGIVIKINRWSPVAWPLLNVLFIMNFIGEIRILKAEKRNWQRQNSLEGWFGFLAVTALLFTLIIGSVLTYEAYDNLFWRNSNHEQGQLLVKKAGGAKTFVDSDGDSLHYVLIKPRDYDSKKKYPLVVCLPYGDYEAGAAELLSSDASRISYHAFIFVPYCPDGEGWGGIPGYPSLEDLVYKTISALPDSGIDVKRRYLTGVSRGGYGTWEFICSRPDLFAAAIPVCGGGDPKLASKIVNMPVWAFHGAKDRNVPVSGSRDMIAAIKKAGGHPEYTEYPDEGHDIWDKVSETPGLWNWLFAQKQK